MRATTVTPAGNRVADAEQLSHLLCQRCVGGAIAAAVGLYLFGLSAGTAVATGGACGVFGALVEAISNHGLDNFTIQVAASAAAFVLLA